jgi:SAM-dependent methyltransferase
MSVALGDEVAEELPDVEAGLLPQRYAFPMQRVFRERLEALLVPGVTILDVGAGRTPALPAARRPASSRYIGLDVSRDELLAADAGAYDECHVHDITAPVASLAGRVDIVLSWQVLEHVSSTALAFDAMRRMLRPGGTLLAQLSGSFACFSLAARVLPHGLRAALMRRLLGTPAEVKFPTRYDRCWATAIERSLSGWSAVEIVPFYRGAAYLRPLRPAQIAYLWYESAIARRDIRNLATHYLVVARR